MSHIQLKCFISSCHIAPTVLLAVPQMPLRDLGLKKLWSAVKAGNRSDSGGCGSNGDNRCEEIGLGGGSEDPGPRGGPPACSLPLLQVWPSQDSPRGEADGQSFVFLTEDVGEPSGEMGLQHDSGIDSVQVNTRFIICSVDIIYLTEPCKLQEKNRISIQKDECVVQKFLEDK